MMLRLRPFYLVLLLLSCSVFAPSVGFAQGVNPYIGDAGAIRVGGALFGARCATCHGADAQGIVAPDLTLLWAEGVEDHRVFQTVREGVPGSIMPSSAAPDNELWAIVAYLRSISTVPLEAVPNADLARGESLFNSTCATCHRLNGKGGSMGPDLSRIAAIRSQDLLASAIRDPSALIASRYKPVTLILDDGTRLSGTIKSEDAFSIQIMSNDQQLRGYRMSQLQGVVRESASLMPAFDASVLSETDLNNLLGYLVNTARVRAN